MKTKLTLFITLLFSINSIAANAAGFRLVEQDNAGQAMAHARAASVTDAASVYYNPAAMTEVGKYAAKAGVQFIAPTFKYSGQGTSEESSGETFAIPHIYAVKNYEGLGFVAGFGVFSNFGLATTWPMDGPFRYVATDSDLKTHTFNLNLAKKFGENLSLAFGIDFMQSKVRYDSMYPFAFFVPGSADGIMAIGGEGDGWGWNAAMLYKPNDKIKIGLTYRSGIKTTLSGDLELENFPTALIPVLRLAGVTGDDYKTAAEVDLEYPSIIVLAISYEINKHWLVEVDIDHTTWSVYDELNFKFKKPLAIPGSATIIPATSDVENNWNDVTAFRVGVEHHCKTGLIYRMGYYFDPTPVPEETLSPRLPGGDRQLVSFGVGYNATDKFSLDASVAYLWGGTRSVDNSVGAEKMSTVDGDYENTSMIYGLSVRYSM